MLFPPGSLTVWLYLSFDLILYAASTLKFDDSEKQKKYEIVSFEEINQEINDLKVIFCLGSCLICMPTFSLLFFLRNHPSSYLKLISLHLESIIHFLKFLVTFQLISYNMMVERNLLMLLHPSVVILFAF